MARSVSKALLLILDGYGLAANPEVSAIDRADTPFIDSLFEDFPHSQLSAGGPDVGLPDGQFGNSEVGHLNIGAGRIVRQALSRINKSVEDGSFRENVVLSQAMNRAAERGRLHIMGLFSDGGVHSHNSHLYALLRMARARGVENAWVHAFTDGRDTSPRGGIEYARRFHKKAGEIGLGTLSSIVGRYYAMDRDNRWDRTRKAYELLVHGKGAYAETAEEAFKASYEDGVTDEFITPVLLEDSGASRIQPGDVIIFYNLRGDRARQLTRALSDPDFDRFERAQELGLHYVTFTRYDKEFGWTKVAFPPRSIENTLGEVVSRHGLRQLRIAETEKYPHVTYFFNGGVEEPLEGEKRILIPSPKVATYDLQPEMSAIEVADALCAQLMTEKHHLAVLNFANPDMVGHTGVMDAAIKAVETTDRQTKKVVKRAIEHGYKILIIADHGNADCMIKADGSPHTAHTDALVPAILLNEPSAQKLRNGILADVAPTLLKMMGLPRPEEMQGRSLY